MLLFVWFLYSYPELLIASDATDMLTVCSLPLQDRGNLTMDTFPFVCDSSLRSAASYSFQSAAASFFLG